MSDEELHRKVSLLKRLSILAAIGIAIVVAWLLLNSKTTEPPPLLFVAVLLIIPVVVYLVLLTLWHWKSRYRGGHSNLWGGLLVIETSGWFKLVYLFRHIIPDSRGTGRYARSVQTETKA